MIEYLSNTNEHDRKEKDSSLGRGKLKENEHYDVRNDGHPHLRVNESRTSNVKVGECKSSDEIKSIEPGNENHSKTQPTTTGSKESLENFCNILKAINTTSSTTVSNKRINLIRASPVDNHDTDKRAIYSRLENTKQKRPVQCCHFQRMLFRVTRTKDRRTFFLPAIVKWEQTSNDLTYNCPPRRNIREHSRQEIGILDSRRGDNSNNNSSSSNNNNNHNNETCCCINPKTTGGTETLTGYLVLYDEKKGCDCNGSKKKSRSSKCTCDDCSCCCCSCCRCCCCCCCCCPSDDSSTCCCGECCCKPKKKPKRKSKSDGCCCCCVPQCRMPMCYCMCPCMCNGKGGQSGEHSEKPKHETCTILRNGDSNKNKVCEEYKIIRAVPSSFLNTCYVIDDCQCKKDDKPTKESKPVQTKTTKGTTTKTSTKGGGPAGAKKPPAKKGASSKKPQKAPAKKRTRNMRSLF